MQSVFVLAMACLSLLAGPTVEAAFWHLPSSVPGVNIPNFHYVLSDRGDLYRGGEPGRFQADALNIGITDILIIKTENWNEVRAELRGWEALGYPSSRVTQIPIRWRNSDEVTACNQMMEAVAATKKILSDSTAKLYVHCAAGEDRTGVFVGIVKMLKQGLDHDAVFEEMCRLGYGESNRWKPGIIVKQVKLGLTPMLLKFATWIQKRQLTWNSIDSSLCATIGTTLPIEEPTTFTCRQRFN